MINILDVIIAEAIEMDDHAKNYEKYTRLITKSYQEHGVEGVDNAIVQIEMMSEQANPIKRKIREITREFPRWDTQFYFTKADAKGKLSETFHLNLGFKHIDGVLHSKNILSVNISMRQTGTYGHDPVFLLNTIVEYSLAMKTKKLWAICGEIGQKHRMRQNG